MKLSPGTTGKGQPELLALLKQKKRKVPKVSMRIIINFGLSNTLSRDFPSGTTVGEVLKNPNLKAALGYGDNVVAKIDGVTQDPSRQLVDGDEVDLEVQANKKA